MYLKTPMIQIDVKNLGGKITILTKNPKIQEKC